MDYPLQHFVNGPIASNGGYLGPTLLGSHLGESRTMSRCAGLGYIVFYPLGTENFLYLG